MSKSKTKPRITEPRPPKVLVSFKYKAETVNVLIDDDTAWFIRNDGFHDGIEISHLWNCLPDHDDEPTMSYTIIT